MTYYGSSRPKSCYLVRKQAERQRVSASRMPGLTSSRALPPAIVGVSTVFCTWIFDALNSDYPQGYFELYVKGGPLDGHDERYLDLRDATVGRALLVEHLEALLPPVV